MRRLIIDGSNLRQGGGVTHIVELLNNSNSKEIEKKFDEVIVFSNENTLSKINDKPWLVKSSHYLINKNLIYILIWRFSFLNSFLRKEKKKNKSVLLNPAGTYIGSFNPYIGMCRNMLIFDKNESNRYKELKLKLRFRILRVLQIFSYQKSNSIIFLSRYARNMVSALLDKNSVLMPVIKHGVNQKFKYKVKQQKKIQGFTPESPFELLYISTIDVYKHQIPLVKVIKKLKKEGFPVKLSLVGPSYSPYNKKLIKELNSDFLYESCVELKGSVLYSEIQKLYKKADAFVFASTCENMPNILIEAMSSGLPILCSNFQPMPEFLGNNHEFYFDPTNSNSIYTELKYFLKNPELRFQSAVKSKNKSKEYSWRKCSEETFKFIKKQADLFYCE